MGHRTIYRGMWTNGLIRAERCNNGNITKMVQYYVSDIMDSALVLSSNYIRIVAKSMLWVLFWP